MASSAVVLLVVGLTPGIAILLLLLCKGNSNAQLKHMFCLPVYCALAGCMAGCAFEDA
jgi:hypothetical protein